MILHKKTHRLKTWYKYLIAALFVVFTLRLITACATVNLPIATPSVQPPPAKFLTQPRVALVLGSGGARGYAHLGVLQALEEAHIPVDVLVGSSAGSVIAALYADNVSFIKTYNIMMSAGFWDFADISNVTGYGGIINGSQLETFLLHNMHARTFDQLQKKVIIATSDVKTGRVYPIEGGPIAPAALASSAIPGAVKPVQLYGHVLIDGGVLNPVPVDLAKKLHPQIIIAVVLSQKKDMPMPTSALQVMNYAYSMMDQRFTELGIKGADVVIYPQVGDIGLFDIGKKREMYLAGLKAARQQIPLIRKLLQKNLQNH